MKPKPQPQRPAVLRALAAAGRLLIKLLRVFFIIMLVIIPVPIAQLFSRPLKRKRGTESSQVLKKE